MAGIQRMRLQVLQVPFVGMGSGLQPPSNKFKLSLLEDLLVLRRRLHHASRRRMRGSREDAADRLNLPGVVPTRSRKTSLK